LHITIVDKNAQELDMGLSPFNKSTLEIYWQFVKMKMGLPLSEAQKANRKLLSSVMLAAGFYPLSHEWWHFNGIKKQKARQLYKLIE
jgi:D-alanyl-D-alanine dipeptidase